MSITYTYTYEHNTQDAEQVHSRNMVEMWGLNKPSRRTRQAPGRWLKREAGDSKCWKTRGATGSPGPGGENRSAGSPSRDRGSGLCAPSRGAGMFTTPSRNHPRADERRAVQTQRWQARREPQGTAGKTAPVTPGSPTGGFLSRWAPRGRPRGGTWVLGAPRSGPGGVHTTASGSQASPQSGRAQAPPFSASVVCSSEAAMKQRGRRRSP